VVEGKRVAAICFREGGMNKRFLDVLTFQGLSLLRVVDGFWAVTGLWPQINEKNGETRQ
jgi:hypothetical protein